MTEIQRLNQILTHIEELVIISKGNMYEKFLYQRLISVKVEVERQLSLLNAGKTVN